MKRFLLAVGLFFVLSQSRFVHSAPTDFDLRSKSVQLHSTWIVAANSSTNTVLVSLSSSTVWPNPTNQTGFININNAYIQIDKLAASSSTVKLGVVTYVDTSTGSVKYFFTNVSTKSASNSLNNSFYESDNSFRCLKVLPASPNSSLDGTTPFLISNDLVSGSTIFQTDVLLPSVNITNGAMQSNANSGNVFPGLGDIILTVINNDFLNPVVVTVDLVYHYDSR